MRLVLIAALVTVFSSCKRADTPMNDNIVRIGLTSEVSTIDPASSYDVVSAQIVYQVYEALYEYEYLKRPYTLRPLLAEEMPKVEDGGKRYIIKIKKNVRYHDDPAFKGQIRFLKAQDFINQFKRLAFLPTQSNGWWLFEGKIKGLDNFRKNAGSDLEKLYSLPVEGLKSPDDNTLVIETVRPYPQMQFALAMSFTSPLPLEAIQYYKNDFNRHAVGTGPFALVEYNEASGAKLKRTDFYHPVLYPSQGDRYSNDRGLLLDADKKLPFISEVHYLVMKESQTRWLNFLSHKIDMLVLPKDNFAAAITPAGELNPDLKKQGIELQVAPTLTYWWLSFNMKDAIVGKNKLLREAIAHAINIDKYIQTFTNNVAQKANSIYPPGVPGYNPTRQLPYSYDLEKAKELLKKAGYPDGQNLPEITYDVRGNSTDARQMAEFIKAELEKIGVKIRIEVNTFPGFLKKTRTGQLQFWQDGWALDYPDAENILQLLYTKNHAPGPNATFYSNKKLDSMFEKLSLMSDGDEKFKIMDEVETIVNQDIPWVMQYYARNYILYYKNLANFRHSDLVYNYAKYLRILPE